MKKKSILKTQVFSIILFTAFNYCNLKAQEGTNTAGGEAIGFEGSASFSIGQVDYLVTEEASSTNGRYIGLGTHSASQGIQQAYNGKQTSGNVFISDESISVYPNPASSYLIITTKNIEESDLNYNFCDAFGRVIMQNSLNEKETKLVLTEYKEGFYTLNILQNNNKVKTFKIIIYK